MAETEPTCTCHHSSDPREGCFGKDIVRHEADRLSDPAVVVREVQRTDQQLRVRIREGIIAKALGQLQARVREAVGFARRWTTLLDGEPGAAKGFVQGHAEQLHKDLSARHQSVLKELVAFENCSSSPTILAGVVRCQQAVQSISDLFDPERFDPLRGARVRHLLHGELLRIGGLALDEEWEPLSPVDDQIILGILEPLAKGEDDWQLAFNRSADARDHLATARIIELMSERGGCESEVDDLRDQRAKRVTECRDALQSRRCPDASGD